MSMKLVRPGQWPLRTWVLVGAVALVALSVAGVGVVRAWSPDRGLAGSGATPTENAASVELVVAEAEIPWVRLDGAGEIASPLKGTMIKWLDGDTIRVTSASGNPVEGRIAAGTALIYEPVTGGDGTLLARLQVMVGKRREVVVPTRVRLVKQEVVGSFVTVVVETIGANPVQGRVEDVDRDALAMGQLRYRQG